MSDDILTRLENEAALCRNDGADDVARLLDDAAGDIRKLRAALALARDRLLDMLAGDDGQAWDEARKAMPRIEAPLAGVPEPSQWRPIETAPRTFSPPLSPINHHAPPILGLWGKAFYCVCSWGGPSQPYWIGEDNRKVPFQPTHWQPLPEPPKEAT